MRIFQLPWLKSQKTWNKLNIDFRCRYLKQLTEPRSLCLLTSLHLEREEEGEKRGPGNEVAAKQPDGIHKNTTFMF